MKTLVNFFLTMLLANIADSCAQSSSYSYFTNGIVPSETQISSQRHPASYHHVDLVQEPSERRRVKSKYTKRKNYKPYESEEESSSENYSSSEEYSGNSPDSYRSYKENDSREYSIGTHIRVQHPITIPKKTLPLQGKTKSNKYSTLAEDYSQEVREFEPSAGTKKQKYSKYYEPQAIHIIAPPKSTVPAHITAVPSSGYDVYEPENLYAHPHIEHLKTALREQLKAVASKKQIDKYLEDQQKILDESLKLQLLSNPKFKQLIKLAEKEQQQLARDSHYNDDYFPNVPPPYHDNYPKNLPPITTTRGRRRPQNDAFKYTPKPPAGNLLSKPKRKYRQGHVLI
uniref:Uncharacterized protein n=1 Tax=Glossina pallidipes TaxID=7398 RepID=A0A1A9ZQ21_GLOPL